MVVRAHHEESASELRAGCSMRSMMALICVIARLGGITVSLHWGGQFGVRESGEPIPAHLWGDGENNDFEAPTQGVGTARKGTSLSDPPPSPYSPMCKVQACKHVSVYISECAYNGSLTDTVTSATD